VKGRTGPGVLVPQRSGRRPHTAGAPARAHASHRMITGMTQNCYLLLRKGVRLTGSCRHSSSGASFLAGGLHTQTQTGTSPPQTLAGRHPQPWDRGLQVIRKYYREYHGGP